MYPSVEVPVISPDWYEPIVGQPVIERLRALAEPLLGLSIVHLNSTARGGGVAELLRSQVGLMRGLGLDVTWQVLPAEPVFFEITKSVHNALQGMPVPWGRDQEGAYLRQLELAAEDAPREADLVVVHDPQPCGLAPLVSASRKGRWVWRCHIDTSTPQEDVWRFFAPMVTTFDAAIFTAAAFVPPGIEEVPTSLVEPSIDPLTPKNASLDVGMVRALLQRYDVDADRPLLVQISRFDPWKDPIGVIDAYRIVKAQDASIQLVLAGALADDDPEGAHYLELARAHAAGDRDVRLLTDADGVGEVEVNALQRAATVAIQKSTREGFGLTVAEAMWKRRPVIGGDVGGIRLQIEDQVNGFLVSDVQTCAERVGQLLDEPLLRQVIGQRAEESVRVHSLCTREVEDMLELLGGLR